MEEESSRPSFPAGEVATSQYETMDEIWSHQVLVGVIGGIGPSASVRLYQYVVDLQHNCSTDEEHAPLLLFNNPQIPNNNRALLGTGSASWPVMVHSANALERAGATHLAIACSTAHGFLSELRPRTSLQILDMIELTAQSILSLANDHAPKAKGSDPRQPFSVGLMATDGTIQSGLYTNAITRVVESSLGVGSISVLLPTASGQEVVQDCIIRIKAGEERRNTMCTPN